MTGEPDPGSVRLPLTGLLEVDGACDRFESALRSGQAPGTELASIFIDPLRPAEELFAAAEQAPVVI